MRPIRSAFAVVTIAALAACSSPEPQANDDLPAEQAPDPMASDAGPPSPSPTMTSPVSGAGAGTDDGYPDMTPPVLMPEAERGETGARSLLLSFARAIELHEFGQAWDMLGERGRGGEGRAAFARRFADMGRLTVAVGDGEVEGGAGSLYYEVPLRVTGTAGTPLSGTAIVRRVNDVDGATPEQLRWHFDRVNLAPAR